MPQVDLSLVDGIIDGHLGHPSAVITILQEIQEQYRYLPREVFPRISAKVGLSEAKVYSVATFYENFSLEPKGRVIIKVCDGTACHVRRSLPILSRLQKELNLTDGKVTTEDLLFTVETVACLGACGLAPVLTVSGQAHPAMTPDKAADLIKAIRETELKTAAALASEHSALRSNDPSTNAVGN
ncbi:MAG: NAD(P)H-dependent oxidoreductase subunit E [Deltaproteobacteria bacterium]|jgi:NADH-quinone oxidoreductase subunit E|nr:NAD(P)H-dependent oxidoreductase subunit E [Deltaproteobacteria bacterium]